MKRIRNIDLDRNHLTFVNIIPLNRYMEYYSDIYLERDSGIKKYKNRGLIKIRRNGKTIKFKRNK